MGLSCQSYDKLSVGGFAIIDDYGEDNWTIAGKPWMIFEEIVVLRSAYSSRCKVLLLATCKLAALIQCPRDGRFECLMHLKCARCSPSAITFAQSAISAASRICILSGRRPRMFPIDLSFFDEGRICQHRCNRVIPVFSPVPRQSAAGQPLICRDGKSGETCFSNGRNVREAGKKTLLARNGQ